MTTTLKLFYTCWLNYYVPAISLISFYTMTLSLLSASLGVTSMWKLLLKTTHSTVVDDVLFSLNSLCSLLILWTRGVPYNSCRRHFVSVRLPAPLGP